MMRGMATYARYLLSGSTNGKPILVAATSSPGTTIHTALTGTAGYDECYAWISNLSASAVALTVEWGGTSDPGDLLAKTVSIPPFSPPIPFVTGQVLQNALVIRAFAGTTNVLTVTGFVNRIS